MYQYLCQYYTHTQRLLASLYYDATIFFPTGTRFINMTTKHFFKLHSAATLLGAFQLLVNAMYQPIRWHLGMQAWSRLSVVNIRKGMKADLSAFESGMLIGARWKC